MADKDIPFVFCDEIGVKGEVLQFLWSDKHIYAYYDRTHDC